MKPTKRLRGPDLPTEDGGNIAIEMAGTVIGYARTVEDADAFIAEYGDDSRSLDFFMKRDGKQFTKTIAQAVGKAMVEETPREARQHMRRLEAFRSMFDTMLLERVTAGPSPNVIYITWEEFQKMHKEYAEAFSVNEHKTFPFQPLSAYGGKLKREGKPPIRHLFAGEVGVWTNRDGQGKICVLKDQGPGDVGGKYFQVPKVYESDKSKSDKS